MVFFDYEWFVNILGIEYLLFFYSMNIQKEITSVDTNDIKGEALQELKQAEDFSKELANHNIYDLDSSRLKIKNDGQKYIFAIDEQDVFCISGQSKFETTIKEFYTEQMNTETDLVVQTTNLRLSIFSKTATNETVNTTNNSNIEHLSDIQTIQKRINLYKEFFKAQINDVKWDAFWLTQRSAGKSKDAYKVTKEVANSQLRILNNMEKRLDKITKKDRYTAENANVADYEVAITIPQFSAALDDFGKSCPEFVAFQNDIVLEKADITSFDLRASINNVAGAQRVLGILEKFNKQEIKLTNTTLELAKQQEYARDLLSLENYLRKVISDPTFDPSVLQFTAKHQAAINYLASDPTINGMLNNTTDTKINDTDTNINTNKTNPETAKPVYTDVKDAFARWGVNGMLDYGLSKTNMNDGQKETRKGIGNLAITGGLIFAWWKFISNAFKVFSKKWREDLKENGGWSWIVWPAALVFGANAWKGESPTSLLNGGELSKSVADRFGGMFGKGKTTEAKTDTPAKTVEEYNTGFNGVQALFDGLSCPQVGDLLEKDSAGKMKLQGEKYDLLVTTLEKEPNDLKKAAALKFLKSIGKDDSNGILDIGLSSMGLSIEKLKDPSNEKVVFNEKAANATVRLGAFINLMATKYNHINPEQRHLIEDYLKNDKATESDLTALEARGDVFEKSEEFPSDEKRKEFKEKIDKFTISDKEKETLKTSLNTFWHLWPTDATQKGKLDVTQEGGAVLLNTYGHKTKIDLVKKTIPWLVDKDKKEITFTSTPELLKAANLTNRIFDLAKVKNGDTPVKDPFNVSFLGRDVEYDSAKYKLTALTINNYKDVTMISGGIGWALKDIAPALEDNKDAYVALLNKRFNAIHNLK